MSSVETKTTEEKKDYVKSSPIEDYLDEDPVINSQKFFILSYILPENNKNELGYPVIKIRGSYSTQEECEKRIERLKNIDKYNNMYICEVGKYGSLLPISELENNDEIDIQYREALLNTMVKEYRENKDKTDIEFEKRKEFLKKRAEYEGSIKGQEELKSQKENPVSVKSRISNMKAHYEDLDKRIKEVSEIIQLSEEQLSKNYTEEEIISAEKEHSEKYNLEK